MRIPACYAPLQVDPKIDFPSLYEELVGTFPKPEPVVTIANTDTARNLPRPRQYFAYFSPAQWRRSQEIYEQYKGLYDNGQMRTYADDGWKVFVYTTPYDEEPLSIWVGAKPLQLVAQRQRRQRIRSLNIPDSTKSPLSEELVEAATIKPFKIEKFDWRKLDINLDILSQSEHSSHFKGITLYSSGN
ncbi:hypothetical protein BU26DRAFT_560324 [Trematosphaeria pertusa]|uniref:Uncharacterized protein n=1 Tax=Trematosphaeria pertusa TaxID=390896 RepID=A0A6A6IS61_9PLEO|nr:uncharacterized protein BU26DRAFT_560324 [Trematosphaeria pertusa]KAF2252977.1 hypothetical protein BU26DRAFT_560324 [Trematosphaeria pertusa]